MNRCTGPPSGVNVKNVSTALSMALNCSTLRAGETCPQKLYREEY